jgi:hypothetical protein
MARGRYEALLDDYVAAGRTLAEPTVALEDSDPEGWLVRSQEVENLLAEDLRAGDGDVREAAALRLQGVAALDLAVAVDLARQEDPETAGLAGDEPSAFETTLAEVRSLLAEEPALGARVPFETAALADDADPKETLRKAAHEAIDAVSKDATDIAGAAVGGLVKIPRDALFSSFGQAADKWLNAVYDKVGGLARIAVKAVTKAASKLLRLLGPLERPVRRWIETRLAEITLDKVVAVAGNALLGVDDVRLAVDGLIEGADHVDRDRAADAKGRLEGLSGRFDKHRKLITTVAKLLGKVQSWLVKLAPWAPAALAGLYVLVLAYGIVAGGDFLDWTRVPDASTLDLVDGVRAIVAAAVA